jgi:cytochrome o ubiquinol oxidase operon protein cyoD
MSGMTGGPSGGPAGSAAGAAEPSDAVFGPDVAPGDEQKHEDVAKGILGYVVGLVLASAATATSFYIARSTMVWAPSIPIALSVLAMAQMGVHLVFFLHITAGPDGVNNLMALAFGLLIVMLLVFGSLWIMTHMNHMQMPMDQIMRMQR